MTIQISYTEKDVEDLLEEDCPGFLGLRFVGRQIQTPVGVIDVLARSRLYRENIYYVIEIKKDALDAAAVCQVLRYTKWMNRARSGRGKRFFAPLLIGANLHADVARVVDYFHGVNWPSYCALNAISYRLFQFSAYEGVSFEFFNTSQRAFDVSWPYGWHGRALEIARDLERREIDAFNQEYECDRAVEEEAAGQMRLVVARGEV